MGAVRELGQFINHSKALILVYSVQLPSMLLLYPRAFALVVPSHWNILKNSTLTSFTSYSVSVKPSLETLFNSCKHIHTIPCLFTPSLFFFMAFTTISVLFLFMNGGIVEGRAQSGHSVKMFSE